MTTKMNSDRRPPSIAQLLSSISEFTMSIRHQLAGGDYDINSDIYRTGEALEETCEQLVEVMKDTESFRLRIKKERAFKALYELVGEYRECGMTQIELNDTLDDLIYTVTHGRMSINPNIHRPIRLKEEN